MAKFELRPREFHTTSQLKGSRAETGDIVLQPKTGAEYTLTGGYKSNEYPDGPTYKELKNMSTGETLWISDLWNWKLKVSYKRPSIKQMVGGLFAYDDGRHQYTFTLMHYKKDDFLILYHTHNEEWRVKEGLQNPYWHTQNFYLALHSGTLKAL